MGKHKVAILQTRTIFTLADPFARAFHACDESSTPSPTARLCRMYLLGLM
jgi:hypothetical protein